MADSSTFGRDSELMTLSEVAAYLNLRERTIYDWAQRGKLPAYKLGSAWRFRRADIESWLAQQRIGPTFGELGDACCLCSRPFTSKSPVADNCSEPGCDQPICHSCWGPRNRRVCPAHASTSGLSTVGSTEGLNDPRSTSPRGGLGSEVGFPLLRDRFLDGFTGRIEGHPRLETVSGMVVGTVRDWERVASTSRGNFSGGGSGQSRRRRSRSLDLGYSAVAYSVPVRQNSLLTNLKQARLEARVVDIEAFREHPGKGRPVPAESLVHMLEADLNAARRTKRHYVVGIFAFDGWEDAATKLFTSENAQERFLNPNLSPVLIGPDLATLVWNANDPVISALAYYFRATFEDEVAECKAHIRVNLKDLPVYLMSRLVDEAGFNPAVAKAAAESLVQEGSTLLIEESGELAIVRKEIS